jgi:signal transduction histidine kinase
VLFWVIYYLPWAMVLVRVVLSASPEAGIGSVTLMLLGAFLVLAVCQPAIVRRMPALIQPFLVLQSALIAALIFTVPLRDYHALPILSVALVATRHLRANVDLVWLAVCCVVPTLALTGAFGIKDGLPYSATYIAGVLCLGMYGRASRKAGAARRKSEELLAQLRAYTAQAEELAAMHERTRLARELHDAVTQTVFGVTLTAEAARIAARQDPAQLPGLLDRIQESSADALAELRALVAELRPQTIARDGLVASLRRHLEARERREKLRVELAVSGEERGSAAAWEAVFRAIQEGLNNVVKHAGTDSARVRVAFGADEITATVRDEGRGFDGALRGRGFGLAGMRERVEALGGTVEVDSRAGAGTEVRIRVPLTGERDGHGEE